MKISRAAQNSALNNHPRDNLHYENHLYGIVKVHIIHNTSTKHLLPRYRIFKKSKFLSHCLITVARLEAKQSSTRPPFYATIANSLVGCAFWGSDECRPSVHCLFLSSSIRQLVYFFIQRNHIKTLIFCINTFFQQHI